MSVFFRTGEGSAVSFPWPVYIFVILPVQAMWLFAKYLVIACAAIVAAVVFVSVWTYKRVRDHAKSRPPTP